MTILIILFFFPGTYISAQKQSEFDQADIVAKSVPDSATLTIDRLTDYFSRHLQNKKELIRSFYFWTSNNIEYDVANMYSYKPIENTATTILQTLERRNAVCQGYSALFLELCRNAGIESYIVMGYTRQNGVVQNMNHTWIVANIDSTWTFYDPTWGAGFIREQKFVKRFTDEYFMVKPEKMIKSHFPFDPIWQCLEYPISPQEFGKNSSPEKRTNQIFHFADSIDVYNSLSKQEKFASSLRRIEQNGVINNLLNEYVRFLKQNIEIEQFNKEISMKNEMVNQYNRAVLKFNTGTHLFNEYINYLNKQFKPLRPDREIRQMLDTCETLIRQSKLILGQLDLDDESMKSGSISLKQSIDDILKRIGDQRVFLREYFATPKADRNNLFKRYTWENQQ